MTGHGGWPMTVFLTPGRHAVLRRHVLPARRTATACRASRGCSQAHRRRLAHAPRRGAWSRAAQLARAAAARAERLRGARPRVARPTTSCSPPSRASPRSSTSEHGGLGGAPKFPQPMIWEFVLRFWKRTGEPARAATWCALTLDAHGARRHVRPARRRLRTATRSTRSGWCRTSRRCSTTTPSSPRSTCTRWLAIGDPEYRRIAEETLDYVLREMTRSRRAASTRPRTPTPKAYEGKFFVWTPDEIRARARRERRPTPRSRYWGVDRGPNFEGKSILLRAARPAEVAASSASRRAARRHVARARQLYAARERRVHPGPRRQGARLLERARALAPSPRPAARSGGRTTSPPPCATPSSSAAQMRRTAACCARGRTGQAQHQRLPRGLRHGGARRCVDALRGDLRPALARRVARARRRDAAAVLGRRRARASTTPARDHEALIVRPRNLFDNARAERHLGRHRVAAPARRAPGEERYEAQRAARAAADGRSHGALPDRLRPLPLRARLPPGARGRGRAGLARRPGRGGRRGAAAGTRSSAATCPNRVVAGAAEGAAEAAALPLARRQRGDGRASHRLRLPQLRLPGARVTDPDALARQLDAGV